MKPVLRVDGVGSSGKPRRTKCPPLANGFDSEAGLKLDLNVLLRDGHVKRGQSRCGTISWNRCGERDAEGSFEVGLPHEAGVPGWVALKVGSLDQRIQLNAAARHFGGAQWYFLCPVTGRRVSVLWLPPGARRFASRQAWGRQVAYGSQFETPFDRALSGGAGYALRAWRKDFRLLGRNNAA